MQNGIQHNSPTMASPWTIDRGPRLWPGVVIVILYWAVLKVPALLMPGTMEQFMIAGLGTMALAVLFIGYWMFFSRMRWSDRFLGLMLCVAVGAGAWLLYHPSVQGRSAQYAIINLTFNELPIVLTGWMAWMLVVRARSRGVQFAGLFIVFCLTWGSFAALQFKGVTGSYSPEFAWRWEPSAEDKYIATRANEKLKTESVADAATAPALDMTPADWPEFRGPGRDSRRPGVRISTDWKAHPPKEIWRRRVGPGWSSFAVVGPRLFTQEQLGNVERVVCLDAETGKEVWAHADETRHADSESDAGPRATPTFHEGRIYSLGATGKLNCLDAATGKSIWSHDIVADSGVEKEPQWGFSASPLVAQGIVTVFAGGPDDKGVLGYRAANGELAWHAGGATGSYSSLQPAKIAGVEQILIADREGLSAFDPATGKTLWDYEWMLPNEFNRVTQPALIGDSDVLVGAGFGIGTRRVHVSRDGDKWKTEQVWESKSISPYYNDFVVHKGHIYGFHTSFFTCVNVDTGKPTWKERGYPNGQVLLLPDQDLLLVTSEDGNVALLEAKADARKELGRFKAFTGKTWNHPVIARGKLYLRNGEEAVCYDLAAEGAAVARR
jgi:outer membrane protein assembly factor BamB